MLDIEKEITNIKVIMIADLENWLEKPKMKVNLAMINTLTAITKLQKKLKSREIKTFLENFKEGIARNVFTNPNQITSQWVRTEDLIKKYILDSKTTIAA